MDVSREPSHTRPRDRFGRPLPRDAEDEMPDRVEPDEVVDSVEAAFARGVALFDEQRFFEAHEFFEYIWKHDDIADADRGFWKGVTQVAVGCAHTQRENDVGAVTLLERAASYLEPYPSPHHGIDTDALARAALELAARVGREGASPEAAFPRLPCRT